jgi:hypothetical protein
MVRIQQNKFDFVVSRKEANLMINLLKR